MKGLPKELMFWFYLYGESSTERLEIIYNDRKQWQSIKN